MILISALIITIKFPLSSNFTSLEVSALEEYSNGKDRQSTAYLSMENKNGRALGNFKNSALKALIGKAFKKNHNPKNKASENKKKALKGKWKDAMNGVVKHTNRGEKGATNGNYMKEGAKSNGVANRQQQDSALLEVEEGYVSSSSMEETDARTTVGKQNTKKRQRDKEYNKPRTGHGQESADFASIRPWMASVQERLELETYDNYQWPQPDPYAYPYLPAPLPGYASLPPRGNIEPVEFYRY